MVMKIECACCGAKPHGQIIMLRTEIEIPLKNNDDNVIECNSIVREIPICRKCLRQLVNESTSAGKKKLSNLLRKKSAPELFRDEEAPEVLDLVAALTTTINKPQEAVKS